MKSPPHVPAGVREFGAYRVIGAHADGQLDPEMVILDTNVLFDIRDLYFKGPAKVPAELEDVLAAFPNDGPRAIDVNYGWATTEATWKRGVGTDMTARREFVHAAATVVSWNTSQIRAAFANRHPAVNRDKRWPRVTLDDPEEVADPRRLLVAHYGSVLFLLRLYRDRRAWRNSPLEPVKQFVTWTSDVLGTRDSYALALAVALLVGDSDAKNEANRVLKLAGAEDDDSLADKAWNVAWDLTMVSLAEGMTYALLPIERPTPSALITRDLDPLLIRIGAELKALIVDGTSKMPMTSITLRPHARVDERELLRVLDHDPRETLRRFSRDADAQARQAAAAVRTLEEEMNIRRKAFGDGWPDVHPDIT